MTTYGAFSIFDLNDMQRVVLLQILSYLPYFVIFGKKRIKDYILFALVWIFYMKKN